MSNDELGEAVDGPLGSLVSLVSLRSLESLWLLRNILTEEPDYE